MKGLIINIGRQFGSGGRLVALEIGRILGINVYDKELLSKAAESSGFSAELFTRNDERRSIFSFSSIFSTSGVGQPGSGIDECSLFSIQSRVIQEIAETESAVIIGRCADYILRDRGCTLDVFITCPEEERIRRIMEREGLPYDKARSLMEKNDRNREAYYNHFTLGNWGVASNYDLCVDSSILGIEGTAEHIIGFARKAGLTGGQE
ncbi:MAG: AAA family ATPase [Candidatus Cryptobacteroides sp.]